MKTVLAFTVATLLASSSALAQLSTLPPPSTDDGVSVQSIGANAGTTHWENTSTLAAYRVASDATTGPTPGNPDSTLGLNWAASAPSGLMSAMGSINTAGGVVRGIFTGETAGWLNDFGYTYTSTPAGPMSDSYTVFSNIQSVSPGNVAFGDHFDVRLGAGEAATFDLWLNGADSFTATNTTPTMNGGVYTAFRPENSSPYIGAGNVRWTQSPLMVNTWVPALSAYRDVATYLVSFEDWRLDRRADADYSDFILGVQLYDVNGNPFGEQPNSPVPEPSTYGLIGAAALLGLAAWRRRKAAAMK